MAIDIKEILRAAQKRADAATPATPTNDLLYLLSVAERADQNPIYSVDTTPELLQGSLSSEPGKLYYSKGDKKLFATNGSNEFQSMELPPTYFMSNGKNFGYLHGGFGGVTTTEKLAFSSGTISTVSPGWTHPSESGTGFSSETKGYIAGGATPAPFFYSRNIRIMPFAAETMTTSPQTFTQGLHVTPVSNPNPGTVGIYLASGTSAKAYSVGYIFRGKNAYDGGNGLDTTSKYHTSTDVLSQAIVSLSGGKGYRGGAANDGVNAYISAATPVPPTFPRQQTNLLAMASDTELSGSITVGTPTADGHAQSETMINSSTNVYYSGVQNNAPNPTTYITEIFKYSFSVGSPVTLSIIGDLTENKARGSAHCTFENGYWTRANAVPSPAPTAPGSVDRFPFATEVGAVEIATYTNNAIAEAVGTNLQY